MINRNHKYGLLVAIAIMVFSYTTNPAWAAKKYHKWVDENGVTHYTAHPPRNKPSTVVRTTDNIGNPEAASPSPKENKAGETKSDTSSTDPNNEEPPPVKSPELCEQAKQNKKTLTENARVRIKDGDEWRYLTPKEKKEQLKTANQHIKDNC
jgi:hypothetical protein